MTQLFDRSEGVGRSPRASFGEAIRAKITTLVACLLFLIAVPDVGLAVDAADVTFDDSGSSIVTGADVQEALESTDGALQSVVGSTAIAATDPLLLRTDCGSASSCSCTTSLAAILEEIHDPNTLDSNNIDQYGNTCPTRAVPSSSNNVLVDIGPGTFSLSSTDYLYCDGLSNLSFKGAGKLATTLTGGGFDATQGYFPYIFGPYAVAIHGCTDVEFQDLTIKNGASVRSGVIFENDGGSRWTNMRIQVTGPGGFGWVDTGASTPADSIHFWWDTEIDVNTDDFASGLYTEAAAHRIYSSKFIITGNDSALAPTYGAIWGTSDFDIRVHGSRVAAFYTGSGTNGLTTAIYLGQFGTDDCADAILSVEGSEIEAVGSGNANPVKGIFNNCHADKSPDVKVQGSWFNIKGSTAPLARITDAAGVVDSPYSLGSGSNPPSISTAWSTKTGMDSFTETDCSSTRCNSTSQGSELHVLVFDAACTQTGSDYGPWFDTSLRQCRGTDAAVSIPNGASPPATCTAGAVFLDTDETVDTNCTTTNDNSLCLCTATNTWAQLNNN